jgi:Flp pilus assembly pilin Flp
MAEGAQYFRTPRLSTESTPDQLRLWRGGRYRLPMRTNLRFLRTFWVDRRGQDAMEYVLLVAFLASVAVAIFPAAAATGSALNHAFGLLTVALGNAGGQVTH